MAECHAFLNWLKPVSTERSWRIPTDDTRDAVSERLTALGTAARKLAEELEVGGLPILADKFDTYQPADVYKTLAWNYGLQLLEWARAQQQRRAALTGSEGGRPEKGKPSVNAMVLDLIERNPEAKGWGARKIANVIGCAMSSVQGCPAFKALGELRAMARAARQEQDAKKRQEKDTRRRK
jgi:hypothetical protein